MTDFRTLMTAADAQIFATLGDGLATWSPGPAEAVPIILSEPDEIIDFGESQVVRPELIIEVLVADIAAPKGCTVTLGARTFVIKGDPTRDTIRSVWRCMAKETTP